ncbi:hypothetical protein ACQKP0_10455 [Heyndrickxia sp. NPDC080065]|uniref:hypothetical protein n=1 Tax=Heyndrickxia sp. NPDC080065 TaxID=3390568 RepID=UPI003D0207FD
MNRPYKDYAVIEMKETLGKPFTVKDLTYTFGKPSMKELDKEILYEVPLQIENTTKEIINLGLDISIRSNSVNNEIDLERFLSHPLNKNIKQGFSPNSTTKVMLIYSMRKEWGVDLKSKADLYLLKYNQGKMYKHRISLND